MAKVGILTFHSSPNVGAMLQAYGLSKAIECLGHEVKVIDYRPSTVRMATKFHFWRYRNPINLIRDTLRRYRVYRFRRTFLSLSQTYMNSEDLMEAPPAVDYVVVGSDQVWNTTTPLRGYDPIFFLKFLKDRDIHRVSYAATFGNGFDLGANHAEIASLLAQFESISVRDRNSAEMVRTLIDRTAAHVLDPCFLTDYSDITPPALSKTDYILVYCFRRTKAFEHAVETLEKELQMPVISIKTAFEGARVVHPDPSQWLSLMRHASYVCTDSFHGTCFALINKKPFLTFPYRGGESRLQDVLQTVGLLNRLITDEKSFKSAMLTPINYKAVAESINIERQKSLSFLSKALI